MGSRAEEGRSSANFLSLKTPRPFHAKHSRCKEHTTRFRERNLDQIGISAVLVKRHEGFQTVPPQPPGFWPNRIEHAFGAGRIGQNPFTTDMYGVLYHHRHDPCNTPKPYQDALKLPKIKSKYRHAVQPWSFLTTPAPLLHTWSCRSYRMKTDF